MLMIMRDRIKGQLKEEVALIDLDVTALTSGFAGWGDGFISGDKFVQMLYNYYLEDELQVDESVNKKRKD